MTCENKEPLHHCKDCCEGCSRVGFMCVPNEPIKIPENQNLENMTDFFLFLREKIHEISEEIVKFVDSDQNSLQPENFKGVIRAEIRNFLEEKDFEDFLDSSRTKMKYDKEEEKRQYEENRLNAEGC